MDRSRTASVGIRCDEALLVRRRPDRSDDPDTGWGFPEVSIDDDPHESVRAMLRERGFGHRGLRFVRETSSEAETPDTTVLFEIDAHPPVGAGESIIADVEWVRPPALAREYRPELWGQYASVAPTIETVATDRERGSTALSVSALRALRDRATRLWVVDTGRSPRGDWAALAAFADTLREARPGMVAIANRVNRAMASATDHTTRAVEQAAGAVIEDARDADDTAATVAAQRLGALDVSADAPRIATLSRSRTVLSAFGALDPPPAEVVIAQSRPGGEGVEVGEALAECGPVRLVADAGVAHALGDPDRPIDALLVGADTISPAGSVQNKVGTRGAALAAAFEGIPVYVVAASAKISPRQTTPDLEARDPAELYTGDALAVTNPTFDITPPTAVTGICTERGLLDPEDIGSLARELAALADWNPDGTD
jgi:ribose 1,5-bisphosphate isomerase